MKFPITTGIMITASTAFLSSVSQAQLGSDTLVTLTMTGHLETPGTIQKDGFGKPIRNGQAAFENTWTIYDKNGNPTQQSYEYVSQIVKFKISNRDLLQQFQIEGIINDISGWSLKAVEKAFILSDNPEGIEGDNVPRFFITKAGQTPIEVTDFMRIDNSAHPSSVKFTATRTNKYTTTGNLLTSIPAVTGTSSTRTAMHVTIGELDGENLELYAIADTTSRVMKVGNDIADFFQGGKLVSISGAIITQEGAVAVLDGSWSFTTPKIISDLSSIYPISAPN